MVKITKTFIKNGNTVCNIDNLRKTTFPVYHDNKIALNIKFSRKNDNVAIIYNNELEILSREDLKEVFDVALEVFRNFDASFSYIKCKGFSNDAPNIPRKINRDYVLIKRSIECDKIIMVSTETRDNLIQNGIPFVGYAGEKSIPYHTNVNNTENIVGKYHPYSENETSLNLHLTVENGNDFETNKVLVNKDVWEQGFDIYKMKDDILKAVLPDNKQIDGVCPPNRLHASIHNSSGLYKYKNNTMLDFSKITYTFNEYNVVKPQRSDIIYEEMKTIKCNPDFYQTVTLIIKNKGDDNISLLDREFPNKEGLIKWYDWYKSHNDIEESVKPMI